MFTGKLVRGQVLPMNKKAWAAKLKKYAILAGVNEPKKSCHGVRKARAEVAAYADCTESQMMAMFGWTDPKMPAHYIAQANREKLGWDGKDRHVRSGPVTRWFCAGAGAGGEQHENTARERSGNFPG